MPSSLNEDLINAFLDESCWKGVAGTTNASSKYDVYADIKNLELGIFLTKKETILRLSLLELIKAALKLTKIPGMPVNLAKQNLARYGLLITKKGYLFISTNNDLLEQLLREKLSITSLKIFLHRLPGITLAKHSRTLLGQSSRGVLLDLDLLLGE